MTQESILLVAKQGPAGPAGPGLTAGNKGPITVSANPDVWTVSVGGITKADVGLGNADNTSDLAKPISTATQTALNSKAPSASPTFSGTVAVSGFLSGVVQSNALGQLSSAALTKADVGLANVDNTSDLAKPISTATQTALNAKAPSASPTFSGTVAVTGFGAGVVHSNVSGQLSVAALGSAGSVSYSTGSALAYSSVGISGQALVSGDGFAPTWFAPTVGSMLFAGASGALAQDNANLFWDNTNKRLGIRTAATVSALTIKGSANTDQPTLGPEFLSSTGWTSTGWTGDFATGWTHTVGNTSVLSQSTPAVVSTKYQITWTVTGRTAGSFAISFGGQAQAGYVTSGSFGPTASTIDGLQITPTTDFDGTIIVSIHAITGISAAITTIQSSDGISRFEIRANISAGNLFIGPGSGRYTTTGVNNTATGASALLSNTTGYYNTAIGTSSLLSNTTGYYNTATGFNALSSNTTGYYNTATGISALASNTTGYNNTAIGINALTSNTTGYYNTATGISALNSNTTGTGNTALGHLAGYAAGLATHTNCTYIGYGTNASVDALTNSTALGNGAQITASNQVVIGNASVTSTILRGNIDASGGWVKPKSYLVATVPSASASGAGAMIYVSNAAIGGSIAWSDGTNWKTPSAIATLA